MSTELSALVETLSGLCAELSRRSDRGEELALLRSQFQSQEQRLLEPWRVEYQRFAAERGNLLETTSEELERWFVENAKAALLTPMEIMTATYTIYGTADSVKIFAGLILTKRGGQRVRAHNAFVASAMGEAWVATHGERALRCPFPLFPPDQRFAALQEQLLFEADAVSGQGTGKGSPKSKLFRKVSADEEVQGSGWLAVQGSQELGFGVDVTPIEEAVNNLYKKITACSQQQQQQQQQKNQAGRSETRRGVRCYKCGINGHIAKNCKTTQVFGGTVGGAGTGETQA